MSKSSNKVRISRIINHPALKPIHQYRYNKHQVSIFLVDGTVYEEILRKDKRMHIWIFDEKGIEHVCIMTRKYYEKFAKLYTKKIVFENLNHFKSISGFRKMNFGLLLSSFIALIVGAILLFHFFDFPILLLILGVVILALAFFIWFGYLSKHIISNKTKRNLLKIIDQLGVDGYLIEESKIFTYQDDDLDKASVTIEDLDVFDNLLKTEIEEE